MNGLIARRSTMMQPRGGGHNLPPEYQEVEWVRNPHTKNATINTGLLLNNTSWGIKVMTILKEDTYWGPISTGWYTGCLYLGAAGRKACNLGGFLPGEINLIPYITSSPILVEGNFLGSGVAKVNGTIIKEELSPRSQTKNTQILGHYYGSSLSGNCPETYEIAISQGDMIIRDWISCYRKSDGVRGMYDIIGSIYEPTNSPFYTNEDSEHRYIIGPDVN